MLKIIKQNRILFSVFMLSIALFSTTVYFTRLSDFKFNSASVLPYYTKRNVKYVILSREAGGRDRGAYDDFGGSRDQGEDHPVISAAREFHEEAIIEGTIGLNLQETQNYIDSTASRHTTHIIAYTTPAGNGQVTYITNFSKYKNQFINAFYTARKNATNWHNREKDRIAIVKWNDLKKAISNQEDKKTIVTVLARVVDPKTGTLRKNEQEITLRPFLIMKLKGFMRDEPYERGANKKVRFYSDSPIHFTNEALECPAQ